MTPEKQQRAIERICGWEAMPEGHYHPDNPIGQTRPDYLGDLNAMHAAEKVLTYEQKEQFVFWMNHIHPSADIHHSDTQKDFRREVFSLVHSPASQRAEAFLRVMGLWEDAQ